MPNEHWFLGFADRPERETTIKCNAHYFPNLCPCKVNPRINTKLFIRIPFGINSNRKSLYNLWTNSLNTTRDITKCLQIFPSVFISGSNEPVDRTSNDGFHDSASTVASWWLLPATILSRYFWNVFPLHFIKLSKVASWWLLPCHHFVTILLTCWGEMFFSLHFIKLSKKI